MNRRPDPTAALLDRIERLERANAILRRERMRSRRRISGVLRSVLQLLAAFAVIAIALRVLSYVVVFACFLFGGAVGPT